MSAREILSLLPLREKVAAKRSDEGFSPIRPRDPSSDGLGPPPSPARGEGE
jgi:hypothetical protein